MEVLSSLFTILVIVLLGVLGRRFGIFKAEHAKTISSYVYYFGLPALFFTKISNLDLASVDPLFALGSLLPTMILLALLLLGFLLRLLKKDAFILLGLSISFGSYAFFGIAFFETFQDGRWLDYAVLAASLLGVLGIIATLSLLEFANHKQQQGSFLGKIVSNPLILSIMLGVFCSVIGLKLDFLENALTLVGQTASALAIFVLGMFIYDRFSWKILVGALPYSLFRMIALPAITWIILQLILPGSGEMAQFLLLENGMPAAIALVVFAERYDYRVTETAGIVSLTSILSFLGLTVIYYLSTMGI
jgi:malonate transporter